MQNILLSKFSIGLKNALWFSVAIAYWNYSFSGQTPKGIPKNTLILIIYKCMWNILCAFVVLFVIILSTVFMKRKKLLSLGYNLTALPWVLSNKSYNL